VDSEVGNAARDRGRHNWRWPGAAARRGSLNTPRLLPSDRHYDNIVVGRRRGYRASRNARTADRGLVFTAIAGGYASRLDPGSQKPVASYRAYSTHADG
jgi:hypothetical protein